MDGSQLQVKPLSCFDLKSQNDVKLMTLPFGQTLTVINTNTVLCSYLGVWWCDCGEKNNPYYPLEYLLFVVAL